MDDTPNSSIKLHTENGNGADAGTKSNEPTSTTSGDSVRIVRDNFFLSLKQFSLQLNLNSIANLICFCLQVDLTLSDSDEDIVPFQRKNLGINTVKSVVPNKARPGTPVIANGRSRPQY